MRNPLFDLAVLILLVSSASFAAERVRTEFDAETDKQGPKKAAKLTRRILRRYPPK